MIMHNFNDYNFDIQQLKKRCGAISMNLSGAAIKQVYKDILGLIDLTTLSGADNIKKVKNLCLKGMSYADDSQEIPNVAAICVYPVFAKLVSSGLDGSGINTACVAGAFPSGHSPLDLRIAEVAYAIAEGADEIDMVISRGRLLEGDYDFVMNEVKGIKAVCGGTHLKVILETGELKKPSLIRKACELSILGGADFLKTSTGKIEPAATHEAFLIMLDTIKEYFDKTGKMIGIKAAGGISTPGEAVSYYLLVKNILGEEWLNKGYFRIGASRLADNIYNAIIE
ncbi:MAG: deoxyribose-phosphate aldolase [Chlorobi bacterium]|nr:deoxyribose-phosphate aldolase [Chlorobiota bacterium]